MSKFEIQKGASATIKKKVMPSTVPIVASQFRGGCITRLDRQLIPNGGFSTLRNFRWLHPGLETRRGQTRQHSTAGAGVVRNIYQFRKQNGEKHFLRQLTDGTLEEATTNPPLTTVGSFGTQSLPSLAGTRSASFTTVLDRCLFSDGERLKIFSGTSSDPLAFVVYKGTTAISRIPVEGEDFKKEVTDGNTALSAILDALSTLASNHAVFIMSPVKAKAFTFTVPTVNTNASVITLKYWNGVFTTVANIDGTILLLFTLPWVERQPAGVVDRQWNTAASSSDGVKLIVGVEDGRLYTSTDSGVSWTERQPAGAVNLGWHSTTSSSDGTKLMAGVAIGRLYTSTDSGVSWTERQPAGAVDRQWRLAASSSDGTKLIAGAFGGRLYTSTDSGVSWTERQPAGAVDRSWWLAASSSDGTKLIAGAFGGRLYTSTDSGVTWTERQPAGAVDRSWKTAASSSDGTKLIAGVFNGRLYTSTDSGVTWTERQPAGAVDRFWGTVASSSDGIRLIAGVSGGRLYNSTDSGVTWTETQPAGAVDLTWKSSASSSDGTKLIAGAYGGRLYTVVANIGNVTMGQSGTVSWTPQSDEIPSYMFGESGFWYQLSFSAALSATVRVSEVTYNSFWQDVVNVWDGVLNNAIEGQVFDSSTNNYRTFGSNSIDLNRLHTADYVYFSTIDPIEGFLLQVGATPNIVTATFTGSTDVTFVDGGTGDDTIKCPQNKFLTSGFEAGMTITVSGTVSNNFTAKIISVSSNTITVPTATTVAESNKSATITFNVSPTALNLVETWTGAGWTSVGATLTDATAGATKDGFVSWNRNAVNPSKLQFNSTGYYAYWYRFKFDKELSAKVNIGIQTIPYFDIAELGEPTQVATWKGRGVYSFKKLPFVYFSHQDEPMFLNGNDFGLIEVGDGRNNEVLCSKTYHNELIVWQEERGVEGGCTTLIEGFSPVTFGRLVLSNRIGILNTKCATVVEGVSINTSGQEAIKTIAFWLSREGVMATDGTTVFNLSYEINNFFDPTKPECIRLGYEDKHWLEYDSSYRILRVGLVSGSSATEPNIFLVYDVLEKAWGFDVVSQSLTCVAEIEAASGNVAILQMAGSSDTFVYQANNGTLDNIDPIVPEAVMELDGGGRKLKLLGEYLRVKSQTTGNIVRTLDINTINTFTGNTTTLPLQPLQAGEQYRRHRFRENILGDHLSIKWTTDGVAPTDNVVLHDLGLEVHSFETGR